MTIDEVIGYEKKCSERSDAFVGYTTEEHKQLAEWLEELKFIRQWKADVMEGFCKYDASSFEEIIHNARNKAIDEFVEKLYQDYVYDNICRDDISFYGFGNQIKSIAEQIKK